MELPAKLVRSQLNFFKPFVAGCSLETTRKGQDKLGELMSALHRREVIDRDHDFGAFQGAWVMPKDERRSGVVLYLHGGGYTCGSLDYAKGFAATLASECGVRVFCAAYRADEFEELLQYADHIVFNSPSQLAKFGPAAKAAGKSVGLRVNPEYSTQEGHEIYDPCAPGSRLGTTRAQWDAAAAQHPDLPDLLDGLHFHTLCEQDSDALAATLPALEAKFGDLLPRMKWLNFGGGHHITRPDYDLATLEKCITGTQEKYGVQVYLEPGEAWALNAGYLVTTVLDTLQNGQTHLAILDMSAACHTPDVIEMPYRPPLLDAGEPGEKPCTFRLGGPTCLAGDVVGDYSFAAPLTEGDRLIFGDMAIYSTCKNNTFNGMPLPDIWVLHENGTTQPLARFGYHDFKYRLGSPR